MKRVLRNLEILKLHNKISFKRIPYKWQACYDIETTEITLDVCSMFAWAYIHEWFHFRYPKLSHPPLCKKINRYWERMSDDEIHELGFRLLKLWIRAKRD